MAKKGFKKYEYEDIRTEYYSELTTQAEQTIPAGTVIKVDSGAASDTTEAEDITAATINETVFILAEDLVKGETGFVYYIVENIDNLEDRV